MIDNTLQLLSSYKSCLNYSTSVWLQLLLVKSVRIYGETGIIQSDLKTERRSVPLIPSKMHLYCLHYRKKCTLVTFIAAKNFSSYKTLQICLEYFNIIYLSASIKYKYEATLSIDQNLRLLIIPQLERQNRF